MHRRSIRVELGWRNGGDGRWNASQKVMHKKIKPVYFTDKFWIDVMDKNKGGMVYLKKHYYF